MCMYICTDGHVLGTLLIMDAHGVLVLMHKFKPGVPDQTHYQAVGQLAAAVTLQFQLTTTTILGVRARMYPEATRPLIVSGSP